MSLIRKKRALVGSSSSSPAKAAENRFGSTSISLMGLTLISWPLLPITTFQNKRKVSRDGVGSTFYIPFKCLQRMCVARDYRHLKPTITGMAKSFLLYHEAYRCLLVSNYLSKHRIQVLPKQAYSPDLAPCDIFLGRKFWIRGNDSQVPKKCSDEGTG
ncbi:hypothetical protein AVEN_248430-1, partial [Araneus ventricosus]